MNLGVYLDLVANFLLTEILLMKNSEFRRFGQNLGPRFRRRLISREKTCIFTKFHQFPGKKRVFSIFSVYLGFWRQNGN